MPYVHHSGGWYKILVPGEGFEPPTFGLQNRCTTTVLTRPRRLESGFDERKLPPRLPLVSLCISKRSVDTPGVVLMQGHDSEGTCPSPPPATIVVFVAIATLVMVVLMVVGLLIHCGGWRKRWTHASP